MFACGRKARPHRKSMFLKNTLHCRHTQLQWRVQDTERKNVRDSHSKGHTSSPLHLNHLFLWWSLSHQHTHMRCTYRRDMCHKTYYHLHVPLVNILVKVCKCVWVTSLACKTVLNSGQRPARGEWVSSSLWSGAFWAFPLLFAAILSLEDNQGMFGPCLPNLLLARASGTQTLPLSRLRPFIFHFLFSNFFPHMLAKHSLIKALAQGSDQRFCGLHNVWVSKWLNM